jgi:hypothetical protein
VTRWLILAAMVAVTWCVAICRSNRRADQAAAEQATLAAEFNAIVDPDRRPGTVHPHLIAALEQQFERSEQ